jgi:serine/threonine-protein kinase
VYALGVVLYRTLANHLPWPTESIVQLLGAHRNLPPLPLTVSGLPPAVVDICERCMAKDPADRPTAAELAATLNEALASRTAQPQPAKADPAEVNTVAILPQRQWRPGPAALMASAVGLVALTGVATTWFSHSSPEQPQASAADQIVAEQADCHVDYRLTQDTGNRFAATITVKNTGDRAYADWRLMFGLPGQQTLDPAQARQWTDDSGVVSSVPQPVDLAPGNEVELGFGGRYTDANPFPTTFLLDDHRCSTSLLGMTGRPAVPVTVVAPNPQAAGGPKHAPAGGSKPEPAGHKEKGKGGHGHGD